MLLHHIALATTNMNRMVDFYKKYFGAVEYSSYHNPKTDLRTCFLQFDKGAMLEISTRPGYVTKVPDPATGYTHLAIFAGGEEGMDFLVGRLRDDGYTIVSPPRVDGDGYYESTVMDPDGNWIEITCGRVLNKE